MALAPENPPENIKLNSSEKSPGYEDRRNQKAPSAKGSIVTLAKDEVAAGLSEIDEGSDEGEERAGKEQDKVPGDSSIFVVDPSHPVWHPPRSSA
jgi:hypothetical protein